MHVCSKASSISWRWLRLWCDGQAKRGQWGKTTPASSSYINRQQQHLECNACQPTGCTAMEVALVSVCLCLGAASFGVRRGGQFFKCVGRIDPPQVPGGTLFLSPQCSSWLIMCRSHSKRSRDDVLGDTSRSDVAEGNWCAELTSARLKTDQTLPVPKLQWLSISPTSSFESFRWRNAGKKGRRGQGGDRARAHIPRHVFS